MRGGMSSRGTTGGGFRGMGGPGMGGGSYRGSGSPMSRDNGRPMGGPQSSNNIPCKYNRELLCRD